MSLLVIARARLSKSYVRGHVLFSLKKGRVIYGQAIRNTTGRFEPIIYIDYSSTIESTYKLTARLVGARRSVWVEDPRLTVMERRP